MERLKKHYKWFAPIYNIVNKPILENYRAAIPFLLKKIKINSNSTVLDIGTGTGGFAGILLELTSADITGIDLSPEMLNKAKRTYEDKIKFINLAALFGTSFFWLARLIGEFAFKNVSSIKPALVVAFIIGILLYLLPAVM